MMIMMLLENLTAGVLSSPCAFDPYSYIWLLLYLLSYQALLKSLSLYLYDFSQHGTDLALSRSTRISTPQKKCVLLSRLISFSID